MKYKAAVPPSSSSLPAQPALPEFLLTEYFELEGNGMVHGPFNSYEQARCYANNLFELNPSLQVISMSQFRRVDYRPDVVEKRKETTKEFFLYDNIQIVKPVKMKAKPAGAGKDIIFKDQHKSKYQSAPPPMRHSFPDPYSLDLERHED